MRVLIASAMVQWQRDEGSEIREQIAGLVTVGDPGLAEILVTDCRSLYKPSVVGGQLQLQRIGTLAAAWLRGTDVLHVHHLLPVFRHLVIAVLFRLRGSSILFSPMTFLSEDSGQRSWWHRRPWWWARLKPIGIGVLRRAWRYVAHFFVCVSSYEVASSRLPESKCVLVPWAKPDTPLLSGDPRPVNSIDDRRDGPVAFVGRMDPWRKGIDRLCAWLSAYANELPHPAVLLLAPQSTNTPSAVAELSESGLIEWDWESRGGALEVQLRRCRGAIHLSRYDGQPRSLREALWLGLPIMCTPACCLEESISVLGSGRIVDGDDPAKIQEAYADLGTRVLSAELARSLLNRDNIGRFLLDAYRDIGSGHRPSWRSYYRHFAEAAA